MEEEEDKVPEQPDQVLEHVQEQEKMPQPMQDLNQIVPSQQVGQVLYYLLNTKVICIQ